MSILGFDFYQGPEVLPPAPIDFTAVDITGRRLRWADAIVDAVRYHDAWGVLFVKSNTDVVLFDSRPQSIYDATGSAGYTAHLLLAKEATA